MIAERISSHAKTKWRAKMKQQYSNNIEELKKSLKRKFKTRKQTNVLITEKYY